MTFKRSLFYRNTVLARRRRKLLFVSVVKCRRWRGVPGARRCLLKIRGRGRTSARTGGRERARVWLKDRKQDNDAYLCSYKDIYVQRNVGDTRDARVRVRETTRGRRRNIKSLATCSRRGRCRVMIFARLIVSSTCVARERHTSISTRRRVERAPPEKLTVSRRQAR